MNSSRLARKISEIEKTIQFASKNDLHIPHRTAREYTLRSMEEHIDRRPHSSEPTNHPTDLAC